jgi:hypothetical protein
MTQLPNFFILGAPKSGTSALYHSLGTHPSVHLYLPYVPRRIHETVPNARLVVILRNPVERAFSHWWMQRCLGREPLAFDDALRENQQAIACGNSFEGDHAERLWRAHIAPTRDHHGLRPVTARPYIEAGHYADHLERYLQYYPRSRLCVLFHDDLRQAPLDTMRRLYEFLGLDPAEVRGAHARENVALTGFSRPLFAFSDRLRLDRVLPRRFLALLRTSLSKVGKRPLISPQARDWLRRHYVSHNRHLEDLVGRDLAAWDR